MPCQEETCNSLWLSGQPIRVCQATSFLALAMAFTSMAYGFENVLK